MMQSDHGVHIVKPLRKNGKIPVFDMRGFLKSLRRLPARKRPGEGIKDRTIPGTGQTRRIIWSEFWPEHDQEICRMLEEGIHHDEIAERIGITRSPMEKYLRRMRKLDPVKYKQKRIEDDAEIIDRMLADGASKKEICKRIGYSDNTLRRYLRARAA